MVRREPRAVTKVGEAPVEMINIWSRALWERGDCPVPVTVSGVRIGDAGPRVHAAAQAQFIGAGFRAAG